MSDTSRFASIRRRVKAREQKRRLQTLQEVIAFFFTVLAPSLQSRLLSHDDYFTGTLHNAGAPSSNPLLTSTLSLTAIPNQPCQTPTPSELKSSASKPPLHPPANATTPPPTLSPPSAIAPSSPQSWLKPKASTRPSVFPSPFKNATGSATWTNAGNASTPCRRRSRGRRMRPN